MSAAHVPIEYADASAEVREIYDDIMATRRTDWINNYWKVLAHHPQACIAWCGSPWQRHDVRAAR